MALVRDNWISLYNGAETVARDIMEKITARNQHQRHSTQYSRVTSQIRPMMKKLNTDIGFLRQDLNHASMTERITQHEAERRLRLLDNLASQETQMESLLSAHVSAAEGRANLLDNQMKPTKVTCWNGEEDEETRDMSISEIQVRQKQVIKEQDQGLDALSRVITRQKDMAIGIGKELDLQNEIIDDIAGNTENTHDRLIRETRNVDLVTRKSGSCCYWMLILLILVAIIVVIAVPGKS